MYNIRNRQIYILFLSCFPFSFTLQNPEKVDSLLKSNASLFFSLFVVVFLNVYIIIEFYFTDIYYYSVYLLYIHV